MLGGVRSGPAFQGVWGNAPFWEPEKGKGGSGDKWSKCDTCDGNTWINDATGEKKMFDAGQNPNGGGSRGGGQGAAQSAKQSIDLVSGIFNQQLGQALAQG